MKFSIILFTPFLLVLLLFGCVSQDYGTSQSYSRSQDTSPSNIDDKKPDTRTNDITVYRLSRNEDLSKFIETQNRMNDYAKYENVPTDPKYREMFAEFEAHMGETYSGLFKEMTAEDNEEFQDRYGISPETFAELTNKLTLIYNIEYDRSQRVWYIELIGRSTTVYIELTSNSRYAMDNGLRYYNSVISFVNRWMDLNNIQSLDMNIRLNINEDFEIYIVELFGIPFDL